MARVVIADSDGVRQVVDALRSGDVVGLPTETVYGLAGSIASDAALHKIFAVKGRPVNHPLIVHIARMEDLALLADDVPVSARVLIESCWPGPLTIIVRAATRVSRVVTGGRDTVAVRFPAHPLAQAVIAQLGSPVAAPSANRFGHVSPTTAQHVVADLGDRIELVLDGGPCTIGVESTIVDCTSDEPQILRPGSITADDIARILQGHDISVASGITGLPRASGMLERHYSPSARLVLHEVGDVFDSDGAPVLDCATDPIRAARQLYAQLRTHDEAEHPVVHVVLPGAQGIGFALRDRLTKAANTPEKAPPSR